MPLGSRTIIGQLWMAAATSSLLYAARINVLVNDPSTAIRRHAKLADRASDD